MSKPIPRQVGATWYPVPCPEGMPVSLSFPSEEACASFCEAFAFIADGHEAALEKLSDELHDEYHSLEETAYDNGFNAGREEGDAEGFDRASEEAEEACGAGQCAGYDKGWSEGYAQAGEVLALSAESA